MKIPAGILVIKPLLLLTFFLLILSGQVKSQNRGIHIIEPLGLEQVRIEDGFWGPKLKIWNNHTVYDVLDKLEGKYEPDREDIVKEKEKTGRTRNAFLNFDLVAQGKKNIGSSDGPPWYDGLVYESIRGAADLLVEYPDPVLEKKLDGYIDRIAAAQATDPDGYINTYTTLNRPDQRWGLNGGDDRWQHDVYNAGMLAEAGLHYYKATGKLKLLEAAVKMSNYMCRELGPAPRKNLVPAHAGPEEALLKLYQLFRDQPGLKKRLQVPVNENDYYTLVKYWIEHRGVYADADGSRKRQSYGSYNQDHLPVFEQQTIEGHAVRATLLATAIAATAVENKDERYIRTANIYWDNMVGKRMFITGGQGAIADDEKFGADYFLPESAYLETCAAIGSGFFSQRMNQLEADGKYMDEFERVIYNNMLSGVSQTGDHYHYENPLAGTDNRRWAWHSCPCCPPMFLKMIGALPGYIYARDKDNLYVNLFIGSEARVRINKKTDVLLRQRTGYPWNGNVMIEVAPAVTTEFGIKIRIPGWAQRKENPFDLYRSQIRGSVSLKVNDEQVPVNIVNGYASVSRKWKKGDKIELVLPVEPRIVLPNEKIKTVAGKMALASGPVIYSIEGIDHANLNELTFDSGIPLNVVFKPELVGGINVISGKASSKSGPVAFTAIPFYAVGNRGEAPFKVWLPVDK